MKKTIPGIIVLLLGMFVGFTGAIHSQQKQINQLKQATQDLAEKVSNLKLAQALEANAEWYYQGPDILSSEPDGKGRRVQFKLPEIYTQGYTLIVRGMGDKPPRTIRRKIGPNQRITFERPSDQGRGGAVLGGQLEMKVHWNDAFGS